MDARVRGRMAAALAALAAGLPSHAQQAAEKLERIEITGSRLPTSSDLESASPVAIIRAEDLKVEGFQSLELILNNYPQFSPDQGNRISNGATGTATANLRGLGAQRTLVLVNGRRMPFGGPSSLSPDLNQIPTQLIQRVEVLTGGASAVYGSDAIAGVVNFIMNDRFEGVQADASYGFYNHSQQSEFMQGLLRARGIPIPGDKSADGASGNASLTLGGNFAADKGNAVVSFRYHKSEALLQSERDYSACALDTQGGVAFCGGSSTSNPGRFIDFATFERFTLDRPTGRVRNFRLQTDGYNYAPLNYYQRPQERYGFNAFLNYDFGPETRLYTEFGYHDNRSIAQIAPSGMFDVPALVRWENPLLNDEWRARLVFRDEAGNVGTGPGTVANMLLGRRNTEGGGRQADHHHASFREVLGLKGSAGRWEYNAFFQESRVNFQERYGNDFSMSRALRSLDVTAHPVTGAPVCVSALTGTDPACVPYNLWSLDAITPEALAYVQVPAFSRAVLSQRVLGATASANLSDFGLRIPGTRQGIELAFGVERRTEKLDFEADPEFAGLVGIGRPIEPVNGGLTVNDLFGELRLPVLDLGSVTASYRWSDYDTGIRTNTYGIGFNAAPTKFMRLRASYQKAARAPNVNELFEPQYRSIYGIGFDGDPCAGPEPERSLDECRRTGVTAARYGQIPNSPFNEFLATAGGNPDLRPETATTYTLGLVLTPFRDFSATLDYFDVRLEDAIAALRGGVIFDECINTGNPVFCGLITRDPASQALWHGGANLVMIARNVANMRVSGADLALNYRLRLPKGHTVALDMIGTYLRSQSIQFNADRPAYQCEGLFGSECTPMPLPKWRHRLRATWQPPSNFDVAATWRHVSATEFYFLPATYEGATLSAANYFDLAGSWNISKRVTLRGGVNNIADKDPPLSVGFEFQFNGNSFPQLYDALGRHFFASVTVRF